MSATELREVVVKMFPCVANENVPFTLFVSGYDDDPRELWEIPEVVDFFHRCIDAGVISLLPFSTMVTPNPVPGLGALEVWLMAHGRWSRGTSRISPDDIADCTHALVAANVRCAAIVREATARN